MYVKTFFGQKLNSVFFKGKNICIARKVFYFLNVVLTYEFIQSHKEKWGAGMKVNYKRFLFYVK